MFSIRYKQIKAIVLIKFFSLISKFCKKSDYWVICERGTDARDNGWHFYNYMKREHPSKKVYYIIDKRSADYKKVEKDAVHYGSLKNYWLVARAEKLISSHIAKFIPHVSGKPWNMLKLERKFYFLQHGVTSNNIEFLHKKNARMKLFACGAKPECDFIKKEFGHDPGVVQYTGFARYDALYDYQTKKQLLFMPTWRNYIKNKEEFKNSEFFLHWQNLLLNEELIALLKEKNYELLFYPHYEVQKYIDCFKTTSSHIKICSFNNNDVQTLLKESVFLATDYSSVFFDFAYMKKPMIYYQFDADAFFSEHHKRGYFNHRTDGFGRVCTSEKEVIDEIKKCFENEFVLEPFYEERIGNFFPFYDKNNCQRIYDQITKI